MTRLKLPIGIQHFRILREGGYQYVDKTEHIHRLVNQSRAYFLSRPRRFGKSLLVDTMAELFQGNRKLFEGLWIEPHWDWSRTHPVLHISMKSIGYKDLGLRTALIQMVDTQAQLHGIVLTNDSLGLRFKELLLGLSVQQGSVVLLIDEYDAPLTDYLVNDELPLALKNQAILKEFYSVLKDAGQYLRLLFITGVSKFSKVSIFSELNHLDDLTRSTQFGTLVGYTQSELEHNFEDWLSLVCAQHPEKNMEALLADIRKWYNGYTWNDQDYLYNPFSILKFLSEGRFDNYWFETGTPTFLVRLLRERGVYDVGVLEVGPGAFESFTLDNISTPALLFQTGYLTIKSRSDIGLYTLDYPNYEVKSALLQHLLGAFSYQDYAYSLPKVVKLRNAFLENRIDDAVAIINAQFKSIPSTLFRKKREDFYHAIVHILFEYLGVIADSEVHTSDGRMDAVVQTPTHIYVLEFKFNQSAAAAMAQIRQKDYAARFRASGKTLVGIGLNFSSRTRAVDEVLVEVV